MNKFTKDILGSRLPRTAIAWLLTLVMILGLFPATMITTVSAAESDDLPVGNSLTEEQANDLLQDRVGKSLIEIALENEYYHYDTIDMCGGNSHLQGICVDDELKYMYFSYTSSLAKLDMETGEVVASVGGFGQGSFGTEGGAHLGCLAYYDGWVYGSLEYKSPGAKFFVAAFDTSKLTEKGMDIKSDTFSDGGVTGILLKEPTEDFRDPLDTTIFTGQDSDGHATNEANNGHAFACSGIDGVTFGTYPGDNSGKIYLIVAYGVYAFRNIDRYDNTYNVLRFYDVNDFWNSEMHEPTGTQNIRFTYERGLSKEYTEEEVLAAEKTLFVYTGNTNYGSQNLEYEQDTGNIVLYTYDNTDGFGNNMYVVDGSKSPETKILELGQNNTLSDPEQQAYAKAIADAYSTDANGDGVISDDERLTGEVAVLKCVCGNEASHSPATVGDAEWGTTGVKKADQPICSTNFHKSSTTGIAHIGATTEKGRVVDYFYIADGSGSKGTSATLCKRTTNANGTYSWTTLSTPAPDDIPPAGADATPIVHWTMDADSLNGDGTLTDESGNGHGGYFQNITSVAGVDGEEGGALYFDGTADALDVSRVWMNDEGIANLNNEIDKEITISFWVKSAGNVETTYTGFWSPILGLYTTKTANGAPARYLLAAEFRSPDVVMEMNNYPSDKWPTDIRTYTGTSLADGEWHHVVMTVDDTIESGSDLSGGEDGSQYRRIYVDGVAAKNDRAAYPTSDLLSFIEDFEIGGEPYKAWSDTNVRGRFSGAIDDVQIYNVAFAASDVSRLYKAETNTGNGLAIPVTDYTVGLADAEDVKIEVENAGELSGVNGLGLSAVTIDGNVITLDGDALCKLGLGEHELTVMFTNGSKVINVTVEDDREWFTPAAISFEKSSPANVVIKATELFGTPVSVKADGLIATDYTIEDNTITIQAAYFMQQQPGTVEFTVANEAGETQVVTVYVTNSEKFYPILYYKMDGADITDGMLKDYSGAGIDAIVNDATASADGKSLFFNGYQDTDVQRVYLDEAGVDYLNEAIDNAATFSFWFSSDRITGNYMSVMGLYGENAVPSMMAQFRDSGGERPGVGETTAPSVVNTPSGVKTYNTSFVSGGSVTMNNAWHHMVVVYDGDNTTATVYLDGTAVGTGTAASGVLANIEDFQIGGMVNNWYYNTTMTERQQNLPSNYYGYLDEVKVYNTALTADEVTALFFLDQDGSTLPKDKTGESALRSISLSEDPDTTYDVNEDFDVTAADGNPIKVTATYGNGTTKTIDLTADMVSGFDSRLAVEDQKVTISYTESGITYALTYTVDISKTLESISVSGLGTKYYVGDTLDLTGAKVIKHYNDSTTETVDLTEDMVTNFDSSKSGTNTITITCDGMSTTVDLTILSPTFIGGGGSSASYAITTPATTGGSVITAKSSAAAGTAVVFTVSPDAGYTLQSIVITDASGNTVPYTVSGSEYVFVMPNSKVIINAVFHAGCNGGTDCPSAKFTDVSVNDWFHAAVDCMVEKGIMAGVSSNTFAPGVTTTRGMIVTMLYNLESKPAISGNAFKDVHAGEWYADAVNWAAGTGIVSGYGNSSFGPKNAVTREQLAVILMAYAEYKGYDVSGRADLSGYTDSSNISSWAETAMAWAVDSGIISGKGSGILDPSGEASRAEVAQMMKQFLELN